MVIFKRGYRGRSVQMVQTPLPMANLNFNKYAVVKWAKNRYWTPSPTNYTPPPQEKFFINLIPSMLVYMGI